MPVIWVGAIVVGIGSMLALVVPRRRRATEALVSGSDVLAVQAAEAA